MTAMSECQAGDVEAVAREAGLSEEQTRQFRSSAASWAMEGMAPTLEELRVGAEVAAGRLSFDEARRQLRV
jgi:hypothetical protein